tara:strand:+ start:732 stop:1439 length:708 start_codon:yes stop_codon:yes gene_type:complete
MKSLKNWDKKTWLSSNKYILHFHKFLNKKIKLNSNTKILDIGCGRAHIISYLQKKYKFKQKPVGIDILKNKNIKKDILFIKSDAINYLKKEKKFDLVIVKQTIHLLRKKKIILLLKMIKKNLRPNGKLLILSLKTKNNQIPCFDKMKLELEKSLKKDIELTNLIKRILINYHLSYFNFKVNITKNKYLRMIKERYISCLLKLSAKEIKKGYKEIDLKYKKKIQFIDTLLCISFSK